MKATRRLQQAIDCKFYDFNTEKELLKYFERESKKIDIITHRRKKDILCGNVAFLRKVKSVKQVNLWGNDSYYYYDKDWKCYTLVLIRVYF